MLLFLVLALCLVCGAGAGGYLAGRSTAPTRGDAQRAEARAERIAFERTRRQSHARAYRRAVVRGQRDGERRGRRLGAKRGRVAGERAAQERQLQEAAAAEATRQEEIQSRARERAKNCNAPLFADGYCPTDEEVEQEGQAESLCGGGKYEQARAQGIACFPPGDPRNP
jgi:hypothetical protein